MICDKCSITCCFYLFGYKTLDVSFLQKAASIQEREIRFKRGHSEDNIGVAMVIMFPKRSLGTYCFYSVSYYYYYYSFFFLLSSLNFFVRECSHKTNQYMKLKPF